jgi:hypothetical protein
MQKPAGGNDRGGTKPQMPMQPAQPGGAPAAPSDNDGDEMP